MIDTGSRGNLAYRSNLAYRRLDWFEPHPLTDPMIIFSLTQVHNCKLGGHLALETRVSHDHIQPLSLELFLGEKDFLTLFLEVSKIQSQVILNY